MDTVDIARMIAASEAGTPDMSFTEPRPLKLTIEDLELLDRVWEQDDRYHSTELIDGRVFHTPARYRPQGFVVGELHQRLNEAFKAMQPPVFVGMRGSIAMPPHDLPLPDIVATSDPGGPGFIPVASVPLVVEVAESALQFFLGEKLRLYARHGIPEYWVADVDARVIHQMWAPESESYAEKRKVTFRETIAAATIEGLVVETNHLTS